MSIAIDSMKCRACGKCLDVCPGSLIVRGEDKKSRDPVSEGLLGDVPPVSRSVRLRQFPITWVPTSAAWEAR